MSVKKAKQEIRFLQNAIKFGNKKARVLYSKGSYTKESGIPQGTITIYSKDYGSTLPKQLIPQNDTDMRTDYFEKDRARIKPKSKYYGQVMNALKKQEAHRKKIFDERMAKMGVY